MNERNLKEGQWEDRNQWSLGVGQRRKSFETDIYIYMCIYIYIYGTVYQTVRCHVPEVRHHRIRQLPTYTVVTFRKIRCKKKILRKSQFGVHIIKYICIREAVRLKSKFKHTGTWLAAVLPPLRMCHRPAAFFRHLRLIAPPFTQRKW